MLTQIKLTNFKCFKEETTFPLSKFNLFTGVNGAGKSTLLQSLLLMRQSIEHNPHTTELILNGSCVNLGSFDDVRNKAISVSEPILFEVETSTYFNGENIFEGSIYYKLEPKNDDMSLSILEFFLKDSKKNKGYIFHYTNEGLYRCVNDKKHSFRLLKLEPPRAFFDCPNTLRFGESNDTGSQKCLNLEKLHFISADRIGPQELYLKSNLPEFAHVGTKGEHAVNLLNKKAEELVNEELCLGEDAKTLITQTEAWLGKILTPLSLEVKPLKANFLELLIGGFRPSNIGFGYSSILPIIVTGLIAKPDDKIIIENPEIHLHPKAQSALVEFLVKVANTGVQIFIESHSDHILNALRIATKEKLLKPEDSNILFFSQNLETKANEITSILIDEKGKLHKKTKDGTVARIPKGFFDEWTNSMAKLF